MRKPWSAIFGAMGAWGLSKIYVTEKNTLKQSSSKSQNFSNSFPIPNFSDINQNPTQFETFEKSISIQKIAKSILIPNFRDWKRNPMGLGSQCPPLPGTVPISGFSNFDFELPDFEYGPVPVAYFRYADPWDIISEFLKLLRTCGNKYGSFDVKSKTMRSRILRIWFLWE